jgi:hypothetical protein
MSDEEPGVRLASIHIYPMKAARAVDLGESLVEPWGLAGDRRWLLVDEDGRFAHRGPADRGAVHQVPVPVVSGPAPVHCLPRKHPERGLSPRELLDLQLHIRAEQQTPAWQAGMRSAPE